MQSLISNRSENLTSFAGVSVILYGAYAFRSQWNPETSEAPNVGTLDHDDNFIEVRIGNKKKNRSCRMLIMPIIRSRLISHREPPGPSSLLCLL